MNCTKPLAQFFRFHKSFQIGKNYKTQMIIINLQNDQLLKASKTSSADVVDVV